MKYVLLVVLLVASTATGQAASPLNAFAGTVSLSTSALSAAGSTLPVFDVRLYSGSGNDSGFNVKRKLLGRAESDSLGHFLLLAANLDQYQTLTLRVKNVPKRLAGQLVMVRQSGSWSTQNNRLQVVVKQSTDPNYLANFGIRVNRYASKTMLYVTDRKVIGGVFTNTEAKNETPTFGDFVAHVALGSGQAAPGVCGIAPDWTCNDTPVLQDDAFIDRPMMRASGPQAHNALARALSRLKPGSTILLFVHGYNNSFDQGAQKAARLSYLMGPLPHLTIFYSWPSKQEVLGYPQDMNNSELSAQKNLIWVLDALASAPGRPRIILAAHSMGARALGLALNLWAQQHANAHDTFGDVALFAGDLDQDMWSNVYQGPVTRIVKRVKFYVNANDQALRMSMCTTGDNRSRVGAVATWGLPIAMFDATKVASTDGFGHGYIVESLSVANDWNRWIDGSPSPAQGIRRLGWLGDGGGSFFNASKAEATFICSIAGGIHF